MLLRINLIGIHFFNFHSQISSSSSSSSVNACAAVGFQRSSEMSSQNFPEHVCYVHCNFCNTILAVSVPGDTLFNIVTVRCGHCANLLSVNMGALLQALPLQEPQPQNIQEVRMENASSSKFNRSSTSYAAQNDQQYMLPLRSPEKRQRVPSAYNRFIKEEIQRIKANNPDISHREAFSAAAKNWAHFPHIHFGLAMESGNKQATTTLNGTIAAPGGQKARGLC